MAGSRLLPTWLRDFDADDTCVVSMSAGGLCGKEDDNTDASVAALIRRIADETPCSLELDGLRAGVAE